MIPVFALSVASLISLNAVGYTFSKSFLRIKHFVILPWDSTYFTPYILQYSAVLSLYWLIITGAQTNKLLFADKYSTNFIKH